MPKAVISVDAKPYFHVCNFTVGIMAHGEANVKTALCYQLPCVWESGIHHPLTSCQLSFPQEYCCLYEAILCQRFYYLNCGLYLQQNLQVKG